MEQIGLVEIAGIALVLGYGVWVIVFFQAIRPRLMRRVGERLGVGVHESVGVLDAGTYDADDSAPVGRSLAVGAADFGLLMLGVPGVLALISIPAFLIAESGAPYRWEGVLMGTATRIGQVDVPDLDDRRSTALVTVTNPGEHDARACRLSVADYRARDGYLTGSSQFFDVKTREARIVALPLQVATLVAGVHDFRVSLECRGRLKDRTSAAIRIDSATVAPRR